MAIAQGDEYEEVDHDAVEELSQTSEEIREEPPGSLRHPPPQFCSIGGPLIAQQIDHFAAVYLSPSLNCHAKSPRTYQGLSSEIVTVSGTRRPVIVASRQGSQYLQF